MAWVALLKETNLLPSYLKENYNLCGWSENHTIVSSPSIGGALAASISAFGSSSGGELYEFNEWIVTAQLYLFNFSDYQSLILMAIALHANT